MSCPGAHGATLFSRVLSYIAFLVALELVISHNLDVILVCFVGIGPVLFSPLLS